MVSAESADTRDQVSVGILT